jgi:hypothetical protein
MTKTQLAEWFTARLLVDYYEWCLTRPKGSHRGAGFHADKTRRCWDYAAASEADQAFE